MSSIDDLKKARTYTKARFTKIRNGVIKAIEDKSSQRAVETRHNQFKEVWRELQQKHEAYLISLEPTGDDEWLDKVMLDYEETQSAVDDYLDELSDSKRNVKKENQVVSTVKILEIQRRQENIRFTGICEQLKTLLSDKTEDARYSIEAVKEFTSKLEECKKKLDCIYNQLIEVSVVEDKDVPKMVDESITQTEKEFNKIYGEAKIFVSRHSATKKTEKVQRGFRSGGLRLEKVKFDTFNGDIRKYPCFRKEFIAHIKPCFSAEEEAFVLKSYLDPEIREEVATLGENADEIWERLDRKYGDEGKLVDSIMTDVKNMPDCTDDDPKSIMSMIVTIERAYRDLKYLSMEQEISNSTIVSFIEQRLPKGVEDDWLKIVTGENRLVVGRDKFPELFKLLLKHKEQIEYKFSAMRSTDNQQGSVLLTDGRKAWCWLHTNQTEHPIWRCKEFQNKSTAERINIARANKACFTCLEQGHSRRECTKGFKCRKGDCGKPHHTLLHVEDENAFSLHGMGTDCKETKTLLLLQEINAECSGQRNKRVVLNCLWDSGSTLSFITLAMAKKLNLKGTKVNLKVTKIGGVTEEVVSFRYNVSLVNERGEIVIASILGLEKISSKIQTPRVDGIIKQFKGVNRNDVRRPTCGDVDILLGLDVAGLHPVRIAASDHLLLLRNDFGLVIGGSHHLVEEHTQKVVHQAHAHMALTTFEELEQLGVSCTPRCGGCKCGKCHPGGSNMTLQEEKAYRMIHDGLEYNEERQKFKSHYPVIKDLFELPHNCFAILGVFKSLMRTLRRDNQLAGLYKAAIQDMLDRKVCRLLSEEEMSTYKGPYYYIAHHPVFKPESKSTPLRIVFDLSASFKGHVLNDYFAKGPSLLNNILGLMVRFCQHEIAFMGDIFKCYHSIELPLLEQMLHRFFWIDPLLYPKHPPQTYVMTVVNFGDRPAGCIAIAAINKTAEMSREEYPTASKVIQDESYMDDVLHSVESRKEAEKLTDEITKVLAKGGFRIKDWVMTGSEEQESVSLGAEDMSERVLGMLWKPSTDKLCYKVKLNFSTKKKKVHSLPNLTRDDVRDNIPDKLTKRLVLGQVNGIYDPRGLLAPFVVRAKIMLRKLWVYKLDWDDPMTQVHREEWVQFFVELFEIEDLEFERCLKPNEAVGDPMLVIFSDGSENAFGAVAYACWEMKDGGYESRIIACKSKIAPIKIENIVRLELCGALLSARLRVFIEAEMSYKFSRVVHLVDSEIVKAMIEKKSYGFRTFVANRIGEIQGCTAASEWFWIPGTENVADWVTRGKQPNELKEGSIWRAGPEFLQRPFEEWPVHVDPAVEELPERIQTVNTADAVESETLASRIDIKRFSNLQVLLKVTARVLKIYKRYKSNASEVDMSELKSEDMQTAERFWVNEAQIELKESIRTQKLVRLTPRIKDGVIVVGGRTKKRVAPTWNNQEFTLLPAAHRFALLVIWDMHNKSGHLGISATTAIVRSKYWIINLPRIVKTVCFICVICRVKRKLLAGQVMATLPLDRLQPSPPFYVTGVDFFGPFSLRGEVNKRSRGKCYGVIFVCYSSRAVHVDVSADYSTDAFLQTMRRFVSIRGWPRRFRSDNGSQLVAASKELRVVIDELDHKRIQQTTLVGGSDWEFSTADAPWMNGATESLVKSVKRALHTILRDQVVTFSELQTVMYEAAELVNERPIGRNPSQPDDGSYLCPNDLLLGRSSSRVPQGPFKERCSNKYRLDFLEKLVKDFWGQWTRDLFPNLVVQPKWHVDKRNVEREDVVLVQDSNALRGQYKMGVVTDVFPSEDGKVRRVEVSYKNNKDGVKYEGVKYTSVMRPVHKLVVIVPAEEHGNTYV